jgi:long-subunit acyl-CoA synthetase (AMP-forming)
VAWQTLMCGGALGFADSSFQSQLLRDLQSIRPRFLLGMSHFWARLHSDYLLRLHADMAAALRGPMEACIRAQLGPELVKSAGLGSLLSLATQSNLWDRVIRAARGIASYQEVYERCVEEYRMLVGDQSLVKAVTGGAHTSPEVLEFMRLLMADGNESGVFNAYGCVCMCVYVCMRVYMYV